MASPPPSPVHAADEHVAELFDTSKGCRNTKLCTAALGTGERDEWKSGYTATGINRYCLKVCYMGTVVDLIRALDSDSSNSNNVRQMTTTWTSEGFNVTVILQRDAQWFVKSLLRSHLGGLIPGLHVCH